MNPLQVFLLPPHYCGLGAGSIPFRAIVNNRHAGHPLLNRRCTRLPGCIRLRNDLYCVEWGVKLYKLTLSRARAHTPMTKLFAHMWCTQWCRDPMHTSIVPWDDTKCIPLFGQRRWWTQPVVRCVSSGQCWCDRLVGSEQPTTKRMLRRFSCTSELRN